MWMSELSGMESMALVVGDVSSTRSRGFPVGYILRLDGHLVNEDSLGTESQVCSRR